MSTGLVENLVDKKFEKSSSYTQMKENVSNYVDLVKNIITFRDQTTEDETETTSTRINYDFWKILQLVN